MTQQDLNISNMCTGCTQDSCKYEDHTFDYFCRVACTACIKKDKLINHSTYTRRTCLPNTKCQTNKTKMKPWAFKHFLNLLDDSQLSYITEGNIMTITGTCCDYIAKFVLCTSQTFEVILETENKSKTFKSTELTNSFAAVSNTKNIDMAIKNCDLVATVITKN